MKPKNPYAKEGIYYIDPIVAVDSRLMIPAIIEFVEQILSRRPISWMRESDKQIIKNSFNITTKF